MLQYSCFEFRESDYGGRRQQWDSISLNPVAQEMRRSNNFNEQYSVGDNNAFVYYHRSKAGTQKV
jgi:hypothetical protein